MRDCNLLKFLCTFQYITKLKLYIEFEKIIKLYYKNPIQKYATQMLKNLIVVTKFQRKLYQKYNPYCVETFMNIFLKTLKKRLGGGLYKI